ncbi:MAG: DedA family protein [Candidatus Woesebacteria bacterium]|nr:MAG: DedA family protein [Candidatus Woesebacteria bacterium]
MDIVLVLNTVTVLFEQYGYLIIFLGSLIEITPLAWAVPGGGILIIAGYISNGDQQLPVIPVIIIGTLGAWLAFLLAYLLGKKTGMWLVKKLHQERSAKFAKQLLHKNGAVILTTSMMANLTRFWVSYIAGVERYNFWKFNLYAIGASLSWVSLMTLIGYFAGYQKEDLKNVVSSIGILAWIFLMIAVFVIFRAIKHEYKHFKDDEPHHEGHKQV